MEQAIELKEKLEEQGKAPEHFRVSVKSLWTKGFKHDYALKYKFVQDKMQDLDVAEKNLNRNIDSKAQQDMFIATASEIRDVFEKRYGDKEWSLD